MAEETQNELRRIVSATAKYLGGVPMTLTEAGALLNKLEVPGASGRPFATKQAVSLAEKTATKHLALLCKAEGLDPYRKTEVDPAPTQWGQVLSAMITDDST